MSPYPDWVNAHRQKGTEIRCINGQYYVYQVSSKWNPEKKRAQKITGKLIGKITPEGFVESSKENLRKQLINKVDLSTVVVKEYGLTQFFQQHLNDLSDKLREYFPQQWQPLLVAAYCRLAFQSPIKQMAFHYAHSYFSEIYPKLALNDKSMSLMLRDIGRDRARVASFMRSFIRPGEHILVDLTHVPLKSEHVVLSKAGYNNHMNYEPQFNVLYIYSMNLKIPVFYRVLPGNIREVKAIRLTLEESLVKDCILIADKGFYSKANIASLQEDQLNYIIPLRRNNQLIDKNRLHPDNIKKENHYFPFEKRFIWYTSYTVDDNQTIFLFLDPVLKVKEEQDFLQRIEKQPEDYTVEAFHEQKNNFGTISIITNLQDKTAAEIFATYKNRGAIESMFDLLKNILEADKSYMQNEETLQGWLFVNHLALLAVYKIYSLLKDKRLISRYSIRDFTQHLLEVRAVKINNQWRQAEIIKGTGQFLAKIGIETIPIP
jgi:transposase